MPLFNTLAKKKEAPAELPIESQSLMPSGEYNKFEAEDTNEYDMVVYSFIVTYLQELHLKCFWKVTPLRRGSMLNLFKGDEEERIFIESATSLLKMTDTLFDWASNQGIHPLEGWFATDVEVE
jgi:hypothetical protein